MLQFKPPASTTAPDFASNAATSKTRAVVQYVHVATPDITYAAFVQPSSAFYQAAVTMQSSLDLVQLAHLVHQPAVAEQPTSVAPMVMEFQTPCCTQQFHLRCGIQTAIQHVIFASPVLTGISQAPFEVLHQHAVAEQPNLGQSPGSKCECIADASLQSAACIEAPDCAKNLPRGDGEIPMQSAPKCRVMECASSPHIIPFVASSSPPEKVEDFLWDLHTLCLGDPPQPHLRQFKE